MKLVKESLREGNIVKTSINDKLYEDMQQAKSILKRLNVPLENENFVKIKNMLGLTPEAQKAKTKQYPALVGPFTKWFFEDNESLQALEDLLELYKEAKQNNVDINIQQWLQDYRNKNKKTEGFDSKTNELEKLYDYMQLAMSSGKASSITKALPSRTRNLVNRDLLKLLGDNYEYANQIKKFYATKGGRYKDIKTLYNDTAAYIKNLKTDFNLETYLEKFKKEKDNLEIVHASPEILIVKPLDYETSCKIGSKSWCISTSKGQWNNYVNEWSNQYFIYDFTKPIDDKKSYIGVTIGPSGISAAHYKDDSTSPPAVKPYVEELLSSL